MNISLLVKTGYQLFFLAHPLGYVIDLTGEQTLCTFPLLMVPHYKQEVAGFFSGSGLPVNWLNRERLTHSFSGERHQYHGSILVLNINSQQD